MYKREDDRDGRRTTKSEKKGSRHINLAEDTIDYSIDARNSDPRMPLNGNKNLQAKTGKNKDKKPVNED